MKQEMITALSDSELAQVMSWVQAEQKSREAKRRAEAIAKIKELAQSAGVSVNFGGKRGRPRIQAGHSLKTMKLLSKFHQFNQTFYSYESHRR